VIVDTSAIIAVLRDEEDAAEFASALASASRPKVSAATWLEAAVVVDGSRDPVAGRRYDDLVQEIGLEIIEVTAEQAVIARAAYRDYGKGSGHPAQLNLGDCFSYALARVTGEPLLFKGEDFDRTDVRDARCAGGAEDA
jgi:ribonuclease VapC